MCIMRGHQPPAGSAAIHRPGRPGETVRGSGPCGGPDGLAMPFGSLLDPGRPGLMQACLSAVLRRARQSGRGPASAPGQVVDFKRRPL